MKEKSGVSMITLVITIIVIIILASVAFNSSTETIGTANYSNYVNNVSEVQQAFSLAVANRKGEEAQKGKIKKTEQVVNAVATGSTTYKLNSEAKALAYTIIDEAAETELGIELPKMTVESLTSEEVEVKYAVTPDGTVFGWPPIENDGVYYSAGDVTATMTENSGTVSGTVTIPGSEPMTITMVAETGAISAPSGDGTTADNEDGGTTSGIGNYVKLTSTTLGSLVTYPVSYTGLDNSGKEYTSETGWKLLSATKNSDDTYDIEIVSVGLPMGVYYDSTQIDSATWKGTETDITNYNEKFSITWASTSEARAKAAAGLYYNLGSINFEGGKTTSSDINKGFFQKIGDVESGTKTGLDLLKATEISTNISIRTSTKEDIESIETTEAARNLGSDYCLASPHPMGSPLLWRVSDDGNFYKCNIDAFGIRPVISISNVPLQSET